MSDISSMSPSVIARKLADDDIATMQTVLKRQKEKLAAQRNALSSLRSTLSTFRTTISGMNTSSNTVLKNAVSMNLEGIANVTASASANKGTYNLNINQLATAEQISFSALTDDAIKNASGTLSLTVDGKSVDINMDGLESLADFAAAVNKSEFQPSGSISSEKTGVTASLVRTAGKVMLMLSSDQSGEKNRIQINASQLTDKTLFSSPETITSAQDAEFTLGNLQQVHKSSSNTLDNLVDGVSIQLTGTTEVNKPLTISVTTDSSGTQEQIQSFINAYNAQKDALKGMMSSGDGSNQRGVFAGDAGIASLSNELSNLLRHTFDNQNMTQFGITADKSGQLKLDSKKLNEQLKNDPQSVSKFFNGNKGLLKTMDKSLNKYLGMTSGLLKGREETLSRTQKDIDSKTEKMKARHEAAYERYLKQFTQMQSVMAHMNNTMNMFNLQG